MNASDTQHPIVIVGGGMVGLSLSLMLAQLRYPVTLLEAARFPSITADSPYQQKFDARNTALSRRSVSIYQQIGIWSELAEHATPIHQVQISEQGGFGKARLLAEHEKVQNFGHVIENAWLGRTLLAEVQANRYIDLQDQVEVIQLEQSIDHASVTYKDPSGAKHNINSPLVIAADGRDSFCRLALGIGNQQHDYQQMAIVTTVQTSKPHQQTAFERFSPLGPIALLPLPGDFRRSIVWPVAKGNEQQWLERENDQHFLDALQQCFGDRVGRFEKTADRYCFPLSQVIADKQYQGRVVLMGNAAHTIHPVAGQGFNLCLRDAHALTRLLKQQQQQADDFGDAKMLARYVHSRQQDQQRVIRFCDGIIRGFSNQQTGLHFARNLALLGFELLPTIKPAVAYYAMGLKS